MIMSDIDLQLVQLASIWLNPGWRIGAALCCRGQPEHGLGR